MMLRERGNRPGGRVFSPDVGWAAAGSCRGFTYQGTKRAEIMTTSRTSRNAVTAAIAVLLLSAVPAALSQQSNPNWLPVNLIISSNAK
jgi:hypothetical protein